MYIAKFLIDPYAGINVNHCSVKIENNSIKLEIFFTCTYIYRFTISIHYFNTLYSLDYYYY